MKTIKGSKLRRKARVIRRALDYIPYDIRLESDNNSYLCHATGYEVYCGGIWWNEFQDPADGEKVLFN